MSEQVKIIIGDIELDAQLNGSFTANKVLQALPIQTTVNKWGDEIYFDILLNLPAENEKELVSAGDIAYWPQGPCLCIFFGPTPMSLTPEEIRPAGPVNVIGKIPSGWEKLKKIKQSETIIIKKI